MRTTLKNLNVTVALISSARKWRASIREYTFLWQLEAFSCDARRVELVFGVCTGFLTQLYLTHYMLLPITLLPSTVRYEKSSPLAYIAHAVKHLLLANNRSLKMIFDYHL